MNILITGSNGQLGQEILQIEANHPHTFFYTRKEDLDITDENAVSDYVGKNDIEVIINAAAYTAVDKAESEEKLAFLVNHKGPQNLAKAAKQNNAFLVHISTDYVFDGKEQLLITKIILPSLWEFTVVVKGQEKKLF